MWSICSGGEWGRQRGRGWLGRTFRLGGVSRLMRMRTWEQEAVGPGLRGRFHLGGGRRDHSKLAERRTWKGAFQATLSPAVTCTHSDPFTTPAQVTCKINAKAPSSGKSSLSLSAVSPQLQCFPLAEHLLCSRRLDHKLLQGGDPVSVPPPPALGHNREKQTLQWHCLHWSFGCFSVGSSFLGFERTGVELRHVAIVP